MRTTIELDDRLFRDLKRQAAASGTTLRQVVNDLLRRSLNRPEQRSKYRFDWKVDPLGTIQPGVRLNDRESLFDLMDGR
ncbi:MAG: type II toxin-antitoxin system VapB family antitoxin [Terriglobia bacterium]